MSQKTALITGCSSGIGRATAWAFLDDDWKVYATARNPADIQTLGDHEDCDINTLDVTDDEDVAPATEVESVLDRLDSFLEVGQAVYNDGECIRNTRKVSQIKSEAGLAEP